MAKIIGRLKEVGIAAEASRGAGGAPSFAIPKSVITVDNKAVKARTREGYGSIAMDGNEAIVTKEWSEGDLEMDFTDKTMGLLLWSLFGSKSVSGPADSAYTHTFSLASTSNQHQSLAISVKESSLSQLMFKLCMIQSLKITVTPEEAVKVAVTFMGKKGVTTTQTYTYAAENKFVGRDLSFKLATLTSGLGAATAIPLKSLVITVEKNLVLDHNLGTVQPGDVLNQGFRITGEVELDYQDRTYASLMSDGSYRAVRVNLTNRRVTIGASTNPSFTLDLSRVEFDQWEQASANDEIVTEKFTFTALHDITNGNVINSCTLVNAQTAYAAV